MPSGRARNISTGNRLVPARRHLPRRAAARGFTLTELLIVIVVIGTIAVVAAPGFKQVMRDSRVNRAAMSIAEAYRYARVRALGRGAALLVRWDAAKDTRGRLQIREAIAANREGSDERSLPWAGCRDTDWSNASSNSRLISEFPAPSDYYLYDLATFSYFAPDGSPQAYSEMCFTPRGRAFIRFSTANTFVAVTGVPRFDVQNSLTGMLRTVFIPPNGNARLAL